MGTTMEAGPEREKPLLQPSRGRSMAAAFMDWLLAFIVRVRARRLAERKGTTARSGPGCSPAGLCEPLEQVCGARNADELYLEACRLVVDKLAVTTACVARVTEDGEWLTVVCYHGRPPGLPERIRKPGTGGETTSERPRFDRGERAGEVWVDSASLPVAGSWREAVAGSGFRSGGAFPLGMPEKVWGWLLALDTGPQSLTKADLAVWQGVGRAVSCALDKLTAQRERETLEGKLRQQQRRFDNLAGAIPGVIYQFRVQEDGSASMVYVGPGAAAFGLSLDPKHPDWQLGRFVHPEDRDRFLATVARSIMKRADFHFEGRANLPDGSLRWFRASGVVSTSGEELVYDGVLTDITAEKEVAALRQTAAKQARHTG